MSKKRVILLNSCDGLYGGVESFLLNVFRYLDKSDFEVIFLTCGKSTYNMFKNEIYSSGGQIDTIPIYPNNFKNQFLAYRQLKNYLEKTKPDIIHINSGALSFQLLASLAAKQVGIKVRILHSHNFIPNPQGIKKLYRNILKRVLRFTGTKYLACSSGAANWMFSKKLIKSNQVQIIPNGINTRDFLYSEELRLKFRKEFDIGEDAYVIGHIGRFQKQKNHKFLIDIFNELQKIVPEAFLMLAGEGELKNEIIDYVKQLRIESKVIFLGERKDMGALLSAADAFVLPSLHEGLPISALEAQASGVNVFLADTITSETDITGIVTYLSINNIDVWVTELSKCKINRNRVEWCQKVLDAGYDKQTSGVKMQQLFSEG